jgi:hypothetical protein
LFPPTTWPNQERPVEGRRRLMLRYVSTRGGVPPCDFEQAVLAGLAAEGLYLPERWPRRNYLRRSSKLAPVLAFIPRSG